MDMGETYSAARVQLCDLVGSIDASTPVPATPPWTAHDVVAHLAGITEDMETGSFEGAPGGAWTARQVERGRSKSLADLVAEWARRSPAVEDALRTDPSSVNFVFDALTHLDDVREAIGAPVTDASDQGLLFKGFGRHVCGGRVAKAGQPALTLVATDTGETVTAGTGDGGPTVSGTRYELVRTLAGRRTREQALGLQWSGGDPEAYVDFLPLFAWAGEHLA